MIDRLSALPDERWPAELGFIPFVGRKYEDGFVDGARVLLLGESHYREDGVDNSPQVTRPFTRDVFGSQNEPVRAVDEKKYFLTLDRLLTGEALPAPAEGAARWHSVAFMNLLQEFAGTKSGDRPTDRQGRAGTDVLVEHGLPLLQPDVILVLGHEAWRQLRAGALRKDLTPFDAAHVSPHHTREREIWELPYAGGRALMTWVYHPSWNYDT